MWFICCLFVHNVALLLAQADDQETSDTIIEFRAAAIQHQRVCGVHPTCGDGAREGSSCCGFCTCEDKCLEHGSCCLAGYSGFPEAFRSTQNSRSECVHAQYLPNERTNFIMDYWYLMINKCDPAYTNTGVKDLCEGTASSIDSFVPVSDPLSMITYRNIFCVYCNGVEGVPIFIDWYLQILSDNAVFLPNLNLLTDIESNRDNVLLIPPHYMIVQPCDPNFSYEISTCNETGLWKRYEEDIETACHSFIDPFNNTYKNYFCYLCNEDEPKTEDLQCERRVGVSDGAMSRFAPVVTISDITGQQQSQKLECTGIEFPDENAMVCRRVFCQNNKGLRKGMCKSEIDTTVDVTCSSFFLKLSALDHSDAYPFTELSPMRQMQLTGGLRFDLDYATGGENVQQFLPFYKLDADGYINYVIIYVEAGFEDSAEKDSYLQSILQMRSLVTGYYGEHDISFNVTVDQYQMNRNDKNATVFVPGKSNATQDELTTELIDPDEYTCPDVGITPLNKLYTCPYVNVDVNQFSVRINGGFLTFYVYGIPIASFSRWEYDMQGDIVSLCFEDFMVIYEAMHQDETSGGTSEMSKTYERLFAFILTVITAIKLGSK